MYYSMCFHRIFWRPLVCVGHTGSTRRAWLTLLAQGLYSADFTLVFRAIYDPVTLLSMRIMVFCKFYSHNLQKCSSVNEIASSKKSCMLMVWHSHNKGFYEAKYLANVCHWGRHELRYYLISHFVLKQKK